MTSPAVTERLIQADAGSHFYWPDGRPCYEVEMRTKPGQMRPATVRDARELGLFPSVTTILGMHHRYQLEAWKQEQVLQAGIRARAECADTDSALEYGRKILEDARTISMQAADFGTRLHAAIEAYLLNPNVGLTKATNQRPYEPSYAFLATFSRWAAENNLELEEAERCFANEAERYGGRIDFIGKLRGERVVIDWQTSRTMACYPDKKAQVCAYRRGAKLFDYTPKIVTISSQTPGLIEVHDCEDEQGLWNAFQDCKRLYFGPLGPWKAS